jgi:murein L,D-transpeptidase YcbB/YkuD
VVEGNRIVTRHSGVVGKPDRPTPILNSTIHELNFNAVWHLPPTVIEKDLIPKGQEMARRGESVLVKYHIDAYGGDGKKLDPNKVNWSAPTAKGSPTSSSPGRTTRWASSRSTSTTRTPSTCTTRPRARSSGATSAPPAPAACGWPASSSLAAWVLAEQGWKPEQSSA